MAVDNNPFHSICRLPVIITLMRKWIWSHMNLLSIYLLKFEVILLMIICAFVGSRDAQLTFFPYSKQCRFVFFHPAYLYICMCELCIYYSYIYIMEYSKCSSKWRWWIEDWTRVSESKCRDTPWLSESLRTLHVVKPCVFIMFAIHMVYIMLYMLHT